MKSRLPSSSRVVLSVLAGMTLLGVVSVPSLMRARMATPHIPAVREDGPRGIATGPTIPAPPPALAMNSPLAAPLDLGVEGGVPGGVAGGVVGGVVGGLPLPHAYALAP